MKNYLNFETEIKDLENELEKLKDPYNQEGLSEVDTQKISSTQNEIDEKYNLIYVNPGAVGKVGFHKEKTMVRFNLVDDKIEDMQVIKLDG